MYKTSLNLTPLLIFDGNCQAHQLSAIFAASGLAEAHCVGEDYGFVPSYRGRGACYTTQDEAMHLVELAKSSGRKVYQVSQSTQMQEFLSAPYTDHVDKIIKFPFLQQYSIAPQEFYNVYQRHVSASRLLDMDLKLIEVMQKKAGTEADFAQFISNAGKHRPLFNTHNHPRGELIAMLFCEVAQRIEEVQAVEMNAIATRLAGSDGINHITVHPVSPEALAELGYDWGSDYNLFCEVLKASSVGDWSFVLTQIDSTQMPYQSDTQMLMAAGRAALALNSLEGRSFIYERMTHLASGFVHSWLMRGEYLRKIGAHQDLEQLLLDLRYSLGWSRYYSQVRAWLEVQAGHYEAGLGFAWDYYNRTPDRPDAVLAVAKLLGLLGRGEEARSLFFDFARMRGASDFPHLLTFVGDLGELEINVDDLREVAGVA